MKNTMKFAIVGAASLVLAACGGKLEQAEKLSPGGTEFQQALYTGYVDLAKAEYNEGDYIDSDRFAEKAMAATLKNGTFLPIANRFWSVPVNG